MSYCSVICVVDGCYEVLQTQFGAAAGQRNELATECDMHWITVANLFARLPGHFPPVVYQQIATASAILSAKAIGVCTLPD